MYTARVFGAGDFSIFARYDAKFFDLVGFQMYLQDFGFHSRPFPLVPDTGRIAWTAGLHRLRGQILAAILDHVPLIVLTGDVGTGKTTFLSALLEDGVPTGTHVAFLRGSIGGRGDLLRLIAADLPVSPASDDRPSDRILAAARMMPLLVIIDEAQAADPEVVLELDRLARGEGRLTLLLSGQPELRRRLGEAEYQALHVPPDHRHIMALPSEEEAQAYIASRLQQAGGPENLIRPDAQAVIARAARRVPRKINKVADACLLVAAMEGRREVDATFATRVIEHDLDPVTFALSLSDATLPVHDMDPATPRDAALPAAPDIVQPLPDAPVSRPHLDAPPEKEDTERRPATTRHADAPRPATAGWAPRPLSWMAGAAAAIPAVFVLLILLPDRNISPQISLGQPAPPAQPVERPEGQGSPETGEAFVTRSSAGQIDREVGMIPTPPIGEAAFDPPPADTIPAPTQPTLPPPEPAALGTATATEAEVARLYADALSADDPLRSAIGYSRAGGLGHDRAAVYIAQKYETGDGVSFSPGMAARWYAVADGKNPEEIALGDGPAHATPLEGVAQAGRIDLVWDGVAPSFGIELADDDRKTLGSLRTPLTAASVGMIDGAAFWRVRATGDAFSDWVPLVSGGGQSVPR